MSRDCGLGIGLSVDHALVADGKFLVMMMMMMMMIKMIMIGY